MNASPYRLLAEGLAAKGFATLRIDNRGMFASAMAIEDANAVTITDYVDDIRSWVKVLKTHIHTHCIWILGHSEGGVVVLRLGSGRGCVRRGSYRNALEADGRGLEGAT
ncbi:alpha/beta hydrolase [Klebsiella quasivariicola]|uniref:alpha/beta hydrolase n=1 Tax=Klebsiella quasivariicola TaxID=2026240 RepID=UPI002479FC37|nr:alpha/beta hydrolase [Klebsiella quasivariicola]